MKNDEDEKSDDHWQLIIAIIQLIISIIGLFK